MDYNRGRSYSKFHASNLPMPIITTRNLFKQFGTGDVAVEVLRGVDLTIESGEFVAVMGPSGSGKSTLMSIIGGIEPPTSGQVILDGVDMANLSDDQRTVMRRRKIGFVFQAFNLIPTLPKKQMLLQGIFLYVINLNPQLKRMPILQLL